MPVYRLIAPKWLEETGAKRVLEGEFNWKTVVEYNEVGYNVYEVPNHPKVYDSSKSLDGSDIDVFEYVFVDCDLKDGVYVSKEDFLEKLSTVPMPTKVVDSGYGIHAYWKITDLDAMSYLRLSRRFMRKLRTDDAVGQIFQLMRVPGTSNTKNKKAFVPCEIIYESGLTYTCEELNKVLPTITVQDEQRCQQHYDKTYNLNRENIEIDDKLPVKFGKLLNENKEIKELWHGDSDDRSNDDFRIGHIMFANEFTKEEATSVLLNSSKALSRSPIHRISYAQNIVEKIWTYEIAPHKDKPALSSSVKDILARNPENTLKGVRFPCHKVIDNTKHGFRLGQVLGLVAGSGVGKTAFALNMFKWFAQENPDYHHFFIPLEQPANEIADRWQTMCGEDTRLHDKVHVISNYDDEGNFRHLSLEEIKQYLLDWQKDHDRQIGCVVVDHIGALKKKGSKDENQDLMTICHSMKAFAVQTNTFLVMQSQTSREKAGIGDLELNKDAAYGTLFFESYCDWLVTIWQPLKRMHSQSSCPTVTAFKFCKIRHKKSKQDKIQEDVPYFLYFDSDRELLRDMTQDDKTSFNYWLPQAVNKRKQDRKTEILTYQSVPYKEGDENDQTDGDRLSARH